MTTRMGESTSTSAKRTADTRKRTRSKPQLAVDKGAVKKLKLVAVAYSHVERAWFDTEEAYIAEVEVEERAQQVLDVLAKLGVNAKGYPGDQYFVTNLLVDDPDLVLNLVDTLKGKDRLQTSIPAALELTGIPYTGAGMQGLVIGNNRDLIKQLLVANEVPTPEFQVIRRAGTSVREGLRPPLIVKLNESGGSVGIDNNAVKETREDAEARAYELVKTYRIPVVVERFINGPEVTVVVYDDGRRRHTFMAQKKFNIKPDGKYEFTSLESYNDENAYTYELIEDKKLEKKIKRLAEKAFRCLRYRDYAKFDVRVEEETGTPYFTDANPNTAFGPDLGLPMTEVLTMHGITFETLILSLLSKHAKKIT